MSRALEVPPPGFTDLPVEQQIDYVQALWDVIAARPEAVPVPEWHREILAERLAEYERDPDEGRSWEEFRAELQAEAKKG
jgi:putative addiction module component (TIGR02574 family)